MRSVCGNCTTAYSDTASRQKLGYAAGLQPHVPLSLHPLLSCQHAPSKCAYHQLMHLAHSLRYTI